MRLVTLLALSAGLVALLASASPAVVAAGESGLIAGASRSYTLTITAGDVTVQCWRLTAPPGTVITGIQGPAGWQVAFQGNLVGGQAQQGSGISPGQSRTFTFTTAADYPIDPANDRLDVSSTCQVGSDRQAPVTGPRVPVAPPPPPPPPDKPCSCKKMSVKLDGTLLNKAPRVAPDDHDFGVGFQWFITCSAGKGKCKGTLQFRPPEILAGELPKPKQNLRLNIKRLSFVCQAPCAASNTRKFEIKMLSRDQMKVLFGRTLAYTIVTKCGNTITTTKVMVSINQNGKLRRR